MLYFIGGASRSGKTLMARRLLAERGLAYLSLDCVVMGFTNGIPQYGIHDKLMPDEIAKRLWGFLEAMCESMFWCGLDYVIEGEAMLPGQLKALMEKHPGQLRACFLGYTEIDLDRKLAEVRAHGGDRNDWLASESDGYVRRHLANMVGFSRQLRDACRENGLRYFDIAEDFAGATDEARRYLLDLSV